MGAGFPAPWPCQRLRPLARAETSSWSPPSGRRCRVLVSPWARRCRSSYSEPQASIPCQAPIFKSAVSARLFTVLLSDRDVGDVEVSSDLSRKLIGPNYVIITNSIN